MREEGLVRGRKWSPPCIEGWEQKMCHSHRPLFKKNKAKQKKKNTLFWSFGSSWLFIQLSPPMRFQSPLSDPDSAVFILLHWAWLLMQRCGWKKEKKLRMCFCQHHFLPLNWVIEKYLTKFQSITSTRYLCSQWHNGNETLNTNSLAWPLQELWVKVGPQMLNRNTVLSVWKLCSNSVSVTKNCLV